jgi:hypothetical protein
MKNGGFALQEDKASESFLSGIAGDNQHFPDGCTPVVAIFHLRGGSVAQNAFFEARQKVYAEEFELHVSEFIPDSSALPICSYSGNLIELKPEARNWIKKAVLRNQTIEYVSSVPPATQKLLVSKSPSHVATPELSDSPESEEPTAHANYTPQHAANDSDSSSLPDSLWMINVVVV